MRKAWTTPTYGLQNDQLWTSSQSLKRPTRVDFKKTMNRAKKGNILLEQTAQALIRLRRYLGNAVSINNA